MDLSKRSENGSVLIIVLVLMIVATSLALFMVSLSRDMVSTSQQLIDKLQVKLDTTSKMEKIIYIGTTSRFSSWNIENKSSIDAFPLLLNLRNNSICVGNSQVRLQDSAGRIGLWPPNTFYLKRILRHIGIVPGEIEAAVDSLLDWVDDDDFKHLNGAESYYYRSEQGKKYLPRNEQSIQAIDELTLVKGWRGPVFDAIRNEIMPSGRGELNMNTADAMVLTGILDVSMDTAEQLIALREKNGILSGVNLAGVVPNSLTMTDEYITNFPSMTVMIDIRTTIGVSNDFQRAAINFKATKDRPFTIESFEE
jgi:hypothetical protein